jgi:hypothetical protein
MLELLNNKLEKRNALQICGIIERSANWKKILARAGYGVS